MPTGNKNYDWLTYEAVFNKERFRRTNKELKMGLYVIPRSNVTVFFRNHLTEELIEKLTDAFFPDVDAKDHLKQSNSVWEWKIAENAPKIAVSITPPKESLKANRKENILHTDTYVVLPYNIYDNSEDSFALGTKLEKYDLVQLLPTYEWGFWKTASRSSVVRTSRVKPADAAWVSYLQKPWKDRDFTKGNEEREALKKFHTNLEYPEEKSLYSMANYAATDFSVKTGVVFVGSENQKTAKKDFLDDNWIVACLRSDYVAEIDEKMRGKRHAESFEKENDIVVLTELLSINETEKRIEGKYKDGIQVRDLSVLDKTNLFVPPLTIPFLDADFNLLNSEFERLKNDDTEWIEYWKHNWAGRLGRAKALFLLRYGLQHINPNPQNYLIEFRKGKDDKPEPTGRMIIRDLQDAALHREVVWALFGPENTMPPEGTDKSKLKALSLPVLKYEFEKVSPDDSQETGSTNIAFGPPGTQFLWQRFSAFSSGSKVNKEIKTFAAYWQKLLSVMAYWGKTHNREYVRGVESQLGVNLTGINWDEIADPKGYESLKEISEAEKRCVTYQYASGTVDPSSSDPVITMASTDSFPYNQNKWNETFAIQAINETENKRLKELQEKEKIAIKSNRDLTQFREELKALKSNPTSPKQDISDLEKVVGDEEAKVNDFENVKDEYEKLKTKINDFFKETAREKQFNELKSKPCVVIRGANFQKDAQVFFGGEPAEAIVWKNQNEIYAKTAKDITRQEVLKFSMPVTVTNPPPNDKSVTMFPRSKGDIGWEENAARVVHDYLKSSNGQKAVRDYHKRGWQPVKPLFRLRAFQDDKPLQEFLISMINEKTKTRWTDMTDKNGEIHIYGGEQSDYGFKPKDFGGDYIMLELMKDDDLFDYKPVKIRFVKR